MFSSVYFLDYAPNHTGENDRAGESALVMIVLREQDNAQLDAIKEAAIAAGAAIAAFFGAPTANIAKEKVKGALVEFYESLKQDRHQNIDGFGVRVSYEEGRREVEWETAPATGTIWRDDSVALNKATDSEAQYIMRVNVK